MLGSRPTEPPLPAPVSGEFRAESPTRRPVVPGIREWRGGEVVGWGRWLGVLVRSSGKGSGRRRRFRQGPFGSRGLRSPPGKGRRRRRAAPGREAASGREEVRPSRCRAGRTAQVGGSVRLMGAAESHPSRHLPGGWLEGPSRSSPRATRSLFVASMVPDRRRSGRHSRLPGRGGLAGPARICPAFLARGLGPLGTVRWRRGVAAWRRGSVVREALAGTGIDDVPATRIHRSGHGRGNGFALGIRRALGQPRRVPNRAPHLLLSVAGRSAPACFADSTRGRYHWFRNRGGSVEHGRSVVSGIPWTRMGTVRDLGLQAWRRFHPQRKGLFPFRRSRFLKRERERRRGTPWARVLRAESWSGIDLSTGGRREEGLHQDHQAQAREGGDRGKLRRPGRAGVSAIRRMGGVPPSRGGLRWKGIRSDRDGCLSGEAPVGGAERGRASHSRTCSRPSHTKS